MTNREYQDLKRRILERANHALQRRENARFMASSRKAIDVAALVRKAEKTMSGSP